MIHKFEMGERVKVRDLPNTLPAGGRGVIVRRYLHSASGEPEYVVRFDHDEDKRWDNDWDVPQSYLEKETP